MNFTCKECNDTGSRDKSGDYLDCGHCDAAMQRKAMNDFLDKLPAMGDYNAAWLVHQRALAMAPKQEAPTPVMQDCGACHGSGWVSRDADIGTEQECFSCDGTGKSDDAAPAVANGALTDDEGEALTDMKNAVLIGGVSNEWLLGFIRKKPLAAGPDAALVKALESALAIINNEADPDEYAAPLKVIRAALSGAKGN